MSSIPVQILLHGLIALVSDPGGANHMTALVLDERQPPAHECVAQHFPALSFFPVDGACFAAHCTSDTKGMCTCTDSLAGKEISLEISPGLAPGSRALGKTPKHPLPIDTTEGGDFSYVANLSQPPFNLTLDPRYLAATPPKLLLARWQFPFDSVTACSLAGRYDQGEFNAHSLSYRILGAPGSKDEVSQALAQTVLGQLAVPAESTVTLHLADFGGANDHAMVLIARPDGYVIDLSNEPVVPPFDAPCDDGVGRHFALFSELALTPPLWDNRPIPHVRPTQSKNRAAVAPATCPESKPIPKGTMDRPICPMAAFN